MSSGDYDMIQFGAFLLALVPWVVLGTALWGRKYWTWWQSSKWLGVGLMTAICLAAKIGSLALNSQVPDYPSDLGTDLRRTLIPLVACPEFLAYLPLQVLAVMNLSIHVATTLFFAFIYAGEPLLHLGVFSFIHSSRKRKASRTLGSLGPAESGSPNWDGVSDFRWGEFGSGDEAKAKKSQDSWATSHWKVVGRTLTEGSHQKD